MSRRFLFFVVVIGGLTAIAMPSRALAFQEIKKLILQLSDRVDPRNPVNEWRLNPITDRDAERWLDRAREAAEREDWKLAADTLCRVIDEYGDRTVSPDGGQRFYSAARVAREQFSQWPAEGLSAYRLLYDGEVNGILEKSKQTHNLDLLREIARKYPLASAAPEAMDLLASWLIDAGIGGEAIEVLEALQSLPHSKIPRWRILSRLVVAYAMTHQRGKSAMTMDELLEASRADPSGVPADWEARLDAIATFVESGGAPRDPAAAALGRPISANRSWPQMMGPPYASGMMAVLRPAVTPEDVWRFTLPGSDRIDQVAATHLIRTTGRPPVWQCVSDGEALFVSTIDGIVALDLATFEMLWRSAPKAQPRDPTLIQFRRATGILDSDNSDRLDEMSTVTLFHEYRGAVSCAHGLVFGIEQFGTMNERFPTKRGVVDPYDPTAQSSQGEANSLRAFEADTGRAAWTRGRGGPVDDELRFVHFFSTPVACGPHLLAPYQSGGDMNLAVFTPDGKLVRRVLLGNGRPGIYPINCVLLPSVHEGTVYVNTGAGLFLALNAYDYSLRWLASYERAHLQRRNEPSAEAPWVGPARSYAQPDEWMSTPPVIVAGVAIIAPPDADRLMAFDRQSGELRWSYPRGGMRYIIGADTKRVILGGDKVMAHDVATGVALWSNETVSPTGRPALCGEEILVPTSEGLVRLSAETGKETGEPLVSREPLGNLLSLDGALYSVSPTSLTKYPDIEQSRLAADQALAQNPNDWRAMLRLAWLGAMQRDWQVSLELLDRAEALVSREGDRDVLSRMTHQRVEILLSLAAESDSEEREPILQKATSAAQRMDDRIRAGLAMVDLLVERGDRAAALERCLQLLAEQGDEPLAVETHLTARSVVVIRERLQRIRQAGAAERPALAEAAERITRERLLADELDSLARLADGMAALRGDAEDSGAFDPLGEVSARLDLEMGVRSVSGHDPESAAYYWERAAGGAGRSPSAREALCRLAILYASPGVGLTASPVDAARVLGVLKAHHATESAPSSLRQEAGGASTIGEFVERIAGALPAGSMADHPPMPRMLQGALRFRLAGTDEVPMSIALRDTVSFFDPSAAADIFSDVVPLLKLSQVLGVRTGSDSSELASWMIDLGPIAEDTLSVAREWATLNTRPAAIAGRIALLASGSRIVSIGLMTGRMMWPGILIDAENANLPDPPVLYVRGMAIIATHANTLIALAARQDGKPVWRRQFPGHPLGRLACVDGQLIVIDASEETLTVLDPFSGRVRRQYSLIVPAGKKTRELQIDKALKEIMEVARGNIAVENMEQAEDSSADHVAIAGGVVCRVGQTRVLGRDISTGRIVWDLPMAGLVGGILRLGDRHVGVCHGRNRLAVVEAATGRVIKDVNAKGLLLPPFDAVVDGPPASLPFGGDRLLLFTRTTDEAPQHVLASFPLKDGDAAWRQELGPLATVSRRMLRASPDYIAVVCYELKTENQQRLQQRVWWARNSPVLASARLFVFDKGGEKRMVESPYPFNLNRRPDDRYFSGLISDVIVLDERIIAVGPDGYYVLQADLQQAQVDPTAERIRSLYPGARQLQKAP